MIVENGKYYLYRFIREDKNQVFYVGVGKKRSGRKSEKYQYWRMNEIQNRNAIWKRIAKKTEYYSEVILETDDEDFLYEKEKEFIKLYGRKDMGAGTLANMTDGGDWVTNLSPHTVRRRTQKNKRNGHFAKLGKMAQERLRKTPLRPWAGKSGYMSSRGREVFFYDKDGYYVGSYGSMTDAASALKTTATSIKQCADSATRTFLGMRISYTYLGEKINPPVTRFGSKKHFFTYRGETKHLTEWVAEIGIHRRTITDRIKKGWDINMAFETPVRNRNKERAVA